MNKEANNTREQQVIKASLIGILTNVLLSAFKAVTGLISGSIAILLDAVNNLSDALSSVITILGMKLAEKPADKKHPYGHGRTEYLTSMLISGIILIAGVTSLVESAKKIFHPQTAEYSALSFLIIVVAVIAKLLLGRYVTSVGKKVNSTSLTASGSDALFDAVISASTLVSAVITMIFHISCDGWLGVIIAVIIIKSGFELLSDTLSDILGERIDPELARQIKSEVKEFDGVEGAYDLQLHSYGPEKFIGSVHIAVPDIMTAKEIQELTRKIQRKIGSLHGIFLTVGIYATNTKDEKITALSSDITDIVLHNPHILSVHGFYVDFTLMTISFDMVVNFKAGDLAAVRETTVSNLKNVYPEYDFEINIDTDFSD